MNMEIITRKEAIERGLKHYFTGKPCKYGHISTTRTSNRNCNECVKQKRNSGRPDGKTYKENSEYINVLPMPADDDTKLVDLSRLGFSTIGIDPEVRLSLKEWQSGVIALGKVDTGRQWCIGDLWNYKDSGSKAQYMESAGISSKSAEQYGWVCRVFPMDMRRANLTFSHHRAIAASELFRTDQERISVLDHIELNGLSVRKIEKWIKSKMPTTTRVEVDPVMADLRAVMRAVKGIDDFPAEAVTKIKELRLLVDDLSKGGNNDSTQ